MIPRAPHLLGLALASLLAGCADAPFETAGACRFTPPVARSTEALQQLASDRGIGGSGISTDERGMGGSGIRSGIVGVVTGFGSICVNGYEIEVDGTSQVSVEGVPATPNDIHLGQLVVIEAESAQGALRAARVDVRLAAMGPVSQVSADGRTLTVLGQTVHVAALPGAVADDVKAGDWIAVSGLRGTDAAIEGSSIVRLPQAGTRAMVAGVLQGDKPGKLGIGALTIANAAFAPGDAVVVQGIPVDNLIATQTVRAQVDTGFSAAVGRLSLQTFVPSQRVFGLQIAPSTVRPMIVAGKPIQIEGRIDRNTLVPERVLVPIVPRDGQRPLPGLLFDRSVIVAPVIPGALRPIDGGGPVTTLTPPVRPETPTPPIP